jgi:hypothetical protein
LKSVGRKKTLMPYYGIAASIIILLTAGIFFIPQLSKRNGGQHLENNITKTTANSLISKNESILIHNSNTITPKPNSMVLHHSKTANPITVKRISPEIKILDSGNAKQPAIASIPQREYERIEAVVPDAATQLSVKQTVTETTGFITKPSLVAPQLPFADGENITAVKPRHTIRSLGGLINAVVAKVDKRRDKIIEFTDEDDETNVTGINLGIVKIKKDK